MCSLQNTEAFASVLSSLAALLPTEPLLEEDTGKAAVAGKGAAAAAAGARSASPSVKQNVGAA